MCCQRSLLITMTTLWILPIFYLINGKPLKIFKKLQLTCKVIRSFLELFAGITSHSKFTGNFKMSGEILVRGSAYSEIYKQQANQAISAKISVPVVGRMLTIKKLLSKQKYAYLRINELSDIRILDMYYWFKESREQWRAL